MITQLTHKAQDAREERARAALAARGGLGQRALEVGAQLFLDGSAAPTGGTEGGKVADFGLRGHGWGFAGRGCVDAGAER